MKTINPPLHSVTPPGSTAPTTQNFSFDAIQAELLQSDLRSRILLDNVPAAAGVDDHMIKPVALDDLLKCLTGGANLSA